MRLADRFAMHCVIIPCIVMGTMRVAMKYQATSSPGPSVDTLIAVQTERLGALTERVTRQEKLVDALLVGVFGNLIATLVQIKSNTQKRRRW